MGAATDLQRLSQAVKNPGRLVLGPTSTSGSYPYGGVSLGFQTDSEVRWRAEYVETHDPSSGRIVEIGRRGVEWPEIYTMIEGTAWDEDIIQAVFTSASLQSIVTPVEASAQGTTMPHVVSAWPPLLFAPYDQTHKAVYFRRPIPTLSLQQSLALSHAKKCGLPVRFTPSPCSSGKDWQVARLENIAL